MSLLSVFLISGSGMSAETERLSAIASNIANADSAANSSGQPYRAREVVFTAAPIAGGDGDVQAGGNAAAAGMSGVRIAGVVESQQPLKQVYDPSSPYADGNGYVRMPNVNPVDEMVNMISATRNYQANLDAFNVAKTLALKTLSI
ncbi:MAG: flagellar basal body rod protein FlgC [Alphaproteobacteria bacterium]|nr:flagellar basal body rod protein FlgC [Alphaproteobacteria bacterium]MDE1967384.1 flagellar basal body rod protein FlgC [Alphaproteobacteria bacterium]MDE2512788.1 flagellar basal body rod protein FlgC [Alphaproteobacteria bacterium]